MASVASPFSTTPVAVAIVVFERRFLHDVTTVLECPRLRTVTTIGVHSKRLDAGNELGTMTSLLDFSGLTLSLSVAIVAGGEGLVTPSAVPREDLSASYTADCFFVCRAY